MKGKLVVIMIKRRRGLLEKVSAILFSR